ncbi:MULTISPECIES: NERD domain-containing protein [Bacillus]|uniref:NERD domain-containing protein n=1 Tax=Bacillus TaxID=1386 RepID=UPI001E2AA528|nr:MULTISPECIES: NERD domain-containing protein [Bacillus]
MNNFSYSNEVFNYLRTGSDMMGQLIKLQDYISRYEQDVYHYPNQFVRLKKQQWNKLQASFLSGEMSEYFTKEDDPEWPEVESGFFYKMKNLLKRKQKQEDNEEIHDQPQTQHFDEIQLKVPTMPRNIDELKRSFLNQVFLFQMKWATSTIRERSIVDRSYYLDEKIKFLLQRFPDTFLVLYQPIFKLKNAPVEADIIMITPTATWCICFLEDEENAVYVGSNEKFWVKKHYQKTEKKILNPTISLNRTEMIVKKIYQASNVDHPIKKAIISRVGYIDFPTASHDLYLLDKRHFPEWFQSMRKLSSPLKSQQLKGADTLLQYCQTTSTMRLEWNDYIELDDDTKQENE